MASADPPETLTCPNCQNTIVDTGATKCEHNFCWVCIECVLDKQHECRVQQPPVREGGRHDGGITCTYCVHSAIPAVTSCVMCEASLCDTHLAVHSKSPDHVLIHPTTALSSRKCPVHKKILEYYCSADATCICVSCILFGDHRGHRVETFDVVSERKKKRLKNDLKKFTSRSVETEKQIQTLQNRGGAVQEKASDVSERVIALFRDIRRQLDALEKRVLGEISKQEEQVSLSLSKLVQQLELEKDELSRKISYVEEMCTKSDPLIVIQEQESEREDFCSLWDQRDGQIHRVPSVNDGQIHRVPSVDDGQIHRVPSVDDGQIHRVPSVDEGLISVTLHTGLCDIMAGIKKGTNVQGAAEILLDINTAGNDVQVSGDLKAASWSQKDQNYPEKPGRFQYDQVLSTRSFSSGRHFWEVETSETGVWFVGMCYPSIDRRGRQSWIGDNNKSWCLRRYDNVQYSVIHDGKWLQLPHSVSCHVLGVYLDYEAGQLSFYELRDPIRHLHTFTATFIEPLHVAFSVYKAWVSIRS